MCQSLAIALITLALIACLVPQASSFSPQHVAAWPKMNNSQQVQINRQVKNQARSMSSADVARQPGRQHLAAPNAPLQQVSRVAFNQQQQQQQQAAGAKMYALDKRSNKPIALVPGLLDETLLDRGSFSFGAKQVSFDKLKVLGNVYVNRVNGRPLRETYLLRSTLNGRNHLYPNRPPPLIKRNKQADANKPEKSSDAPETKETRSQRKRDKSAEVSTTESAEFRLQLIK